MKKAILLTICMAISSITQADDLSFRTECIGSYSIDLPDNIEVALYPTNKYFEPKTKYPAYFSDGKWAILSTFNYNDNDSDDDDFQFASIWPALNYKKLDKYIKEKFNKTMEMANGDPKLKSEVRQKKSMLEDETIKYYSKKELKMPFNPVFWQNYDINQFTKLQQIKGYITLLPIHWTEGENNAIPYHIRLVT